MVKRPKPSPGYSYRHNTASRNELLDLLIACDQNFQPALSSRVDLHTYSAKLIQSATLVEAWHEGTLVGVVAIYLNGPNKSLGFISNVCVRHAYSTQGIATHLVELSLARAAIDGFSRVRLEVDPSNERALALYNRTGFVPAGSGTTGILLEVVVGSPGGSRRQKGSL